ncbi:hypothetical protein BC826DRAFT_722164 [Russula brevipes]|nr:hypothetical protein BC826DRAFT_722164 [Russula brevipes]
MFSVGIRAPLQQLTVELRARNLHLATQARPAHPRCSDDLIIDIRESKLFEQPHQKHQETDVRLWASGVPGPVMLLTPG